MKKRTFAAWIGGVALIAASTFTGVALSASATEICVPSDGVAAYDETIVDTEAYDETIIDSEAHWQRYSWTGGPHESDSAPAFPSDDWQANVQGDPHGVGVAGAYFLSHGNSGNGDWFYLEAVPETSHVVHHEAVTHVVHHEAVPPVTCEEEPVTHYDIALYCYDKLTSAPAAWENSGMQTLAAVKVNSTEDWTTAEKRELCNVPEESCTPVMKASQSDWVMHKGGFTFPEHITYPVDNIGWPPIYKAVHTDLTQTQAPNRECDELPENWTDKGETTEGEPECEATSVETSTEFTDYTYSWGEDDKVVETKTTRTEVGTRDLTPEEIEANDIKCAGDEPEQLTGSDELSYCANVGIRTITTTPWTQGHVRVGAHWELADKVYGKATSKQVTDSVGCPFPITGQDGQLIAGGIALGTILVSALGLIVRRRFA